MDGSEVPDIRLAEGAALLFECAASHQPSKFRQALPALQVARSGGSRPAAPRSASATIGSDKNAVAILRVFLRVLGWAQPGGDEPDSLKATCLAWAGKSSQLVASAGCTGLYAITVGVWPAVERARQAQAAAGDCLSQYWVVRPARSVGAQRYVLRAVTAHKALAEQALRAARRCAPQLTRSLSSYQP